MSLITYFNSEIFSEGNQQAIFEVNQQAIIEEVTEIYRAGLPRFNIEGTLPVLKF